MLVQTIDINPCSSLLQPFYFISLSMSSSLIFVCLLIIKCGSVTRWPRSSGSESDSIWAILAYTFWSFEPDEVDYHLSTLSNLLNCALSSYCVFLSYPGEPHATIQLCFDLGQNTGLWHAGQVHFAATDVYSRLSVAISYHVVAHLADFTSSSLVAVRGCSRLTDSRTHFSLVAVAAHVLLTVALTCLLSL